MDGIQENQNKNEPIYYDKNGNPVFDSLLSAVTWAELNEKCSDIKISSMPNGKFVFEHI